MLNLTFVLLFFLPCVHAAVVRDSATKNDTQEYFQFAYQCLNTPFIANVSVNQFEELNKDLPYESKPASVQLIQKIVDSQIEIQELVIEKTELVQTCGKENWVSSIFQLGSCYSLVNFQKLKYLSLNSETKCADMMPF